MNDIDKIRDLFDKVGLSRSRIRTYNGYKKALFRRYILKQSMDREQQYPNNISCLVLLKEYVDERGDLQVEEILFNSTLKDYLKLFGNKDNLVVKYYNKRLGAFPPLVYRVSEFFR